MKAVLVLFLLPLIVHAEALIIDLRQTVLERQLRTGDSVERLRTGDDVSRALHDSLVMELAYLQVGRTPQHDLALPQFQEFVVLHELLHQNALLFDDRDFQLAPPRPHEYLTGRPRFGEIGRHCLRFSHKLRDVRAYWTELNTRARGRLSDTRMPRELERLTGLLRRKVQSLLAGATPRERYAHDFQFSNLRQLAADLDENRFFARCQTMLWSGAGGPGR